MPKFLNAFFALAILAGAVLAFADTADARGRSGSHRAGGYNSHGSGRQMPLLVTSFRRRFGHCEVRA